MGAPAGRISGGAGMTAPDAELRRRAMSRAGPARARQRVHGALPGRARARSAAALAGRVRPAGRQFLHFQSARCRTAPGRLDRRWLDLPAYLGDGLRHRSWASSSARSSASCSASGSASRRSRAGCSIPISTRSMRCPRSRSRRCSCCGSASASNRRSRSPPCWCCSWSSSTPMRACARSIRT